MIYGELKLRKDEYLQKFIEVLMANGYSVNVIPTKKNKVRVIINDTKAEE